MGRAREYLTLRPEGWPGRLALYSCYLRAALARAVRWSSYRTPGQYLRRKVVVRSEGMRFAVRPGTDDLNYALGGHKPAMNRWFHPRPNDRVVDIGAHIGYHSVRAARVGARVLAFEPNPGLRAVAEENFRLNGLANVELRATAAGPAYGKGCLYVPAVGQGFATLAPPVVPEATDAAAPPGLREIDVVIEPLDGVLADRREFGAVDWLLIDAEGSEASILEGAPRTLERVGQVVVEVVRGPRAERCRTLLARGGLIVTARERQTSATEYWLARRDPTSRVELRSLVPSGPAG